MGNAGGRLGLRNSELSHRRQRLSSKTAELELSSDLQAAVPIRF
jgi:hypothetical protein